MKISGLQKTTVIDYPDKVAAVVFTRGCNFRCPFCHNPELVDPEKYFSEIEEEKIFSFLKKRKGILDGIVITGGEPLIHKDIASFIKKIKAMGFSIKLDTNGTNPELLEKLLDLGLVDYVAMDIKNSLEKYDVSAGQSVNKENIQKSIGIIMEKAPDYEFRSTVMPRLFSIQDFEKIGELIAGAKKYYIQNFRPQQTLDPAYAQEKPFSEKELKVFKKIMLPHVEKCEIRGIM